MRLRTRYLLLRKRLIPWCIRPGCWEKSYTPKIARKGIFGGRGNVCAKHLLKTLLEDLED